MLLTMLEPFCLVFLHFLQPFLLVFLLFTSLLQHKSASFGPVFAKWGDVLKNQYMGRDDKHELYTP
jgi:hypothetical protein